jgi:hypothetical protein
VDLAYLATEDADLWSQELYDSGGLLELLKCSYHFLHFLFRPNGKPYMEKGEVGPAIEIPDALTGEMISIPRKTVDEEHKTLGHFKAPCGTLPNQRAALLTAADKIAQMVLGSYLTPLESRMVYQSVFLTKFSYVLPQCYFTSNQLKKIESKAQQAFTAKSGYNRKMSLAIRYGPISLGGAGFVQLSTIQGEGQLTNFLKHWRSDTYVSSLLRCSLAWAQMNSGISVPLLMVPSISIPHLESIFLKSTRDFLSQIDGQIEVDDPFIPPAQREHDEYLMDIALASPEFTSSDLRVLNYCRLYLQAVTMADIATAHGDALDYALVLGGSSPTSSSSNYCHTNQDLPNPPSWKIWLRLCNLIEAKLSHQPLGQWLLPAPQLRRDWPYYYDHSSSALYVRSATQFEKFHSTDGVSFSDGTLCDWIVTATSVPVGVSLLDDWSEYSLLLPIPWAHVLPTPSIPASFPDYLHELPLAGDRFLFESLELRVPLDELIATLDATATSRNPSTRCHGVSDGTEDNSCMSFAWVLAGPDGR